MFLFKEMLRRVLEHVMSDESFNIAVKPAGNSTYVKLPKMFCCGLPKKTFSAFEKTLVTELSTYLSS